VKKLYINTAGQRDNAKAWTNLLYTAERSHTPACPARIS
jgi:hypothetical protein